MKNILSLFLLLIILFNNKVNAQCAMCKSVVEANLKEGGNVGAGLNEGILYLMAMPYVAVIIFGLFYFIQKRNSNQTV